MATRRIKATINNHYVQPLKLRMGRKLVLTPNCSYNSVLYTQKHYALHASNQKIDLWAKFNTNTFDGIQLVAWLEDVDTNILGSAQCQFKVYYVNTANDWGQTLIHTVNGTASNGKWVASPSQTDLGSDNVIDGDRTLMIEAILSKWGRSYTKKIYLNHLGVYDSIVRLRNDIDFLDIIKADT